jgi:hypothetical protein
MIMEIHTTDTFDLGDPHNDDDGGEVQRDSDYHEPNRSPKDVVHGGPPTTRITRTNN